MEITWSLILDEFAKRYSELCGKEIDSKATKMMVSRFHKRVKPLFGSCSEFLKCDETALIKKVSQLGKTTEKCIKSVRTDLYDLLEAEKRSLEADSRFGVYKQKCDAELDAKKKELEKRYNPKIDAEYLACFITGLEAHGVKLKDVEIDLSTLEVFRKAIKLKQT